MFLSLNGRCIAPGAVALCPAAEAQERRLRRHFNAVLTEADAFDSSETQDLSAMRILIDLNLDLPHTARAYRALTRREGTIPGPVITIAGGSADSEKHKLLEQHGVEVLILDDGKGGIDFPALFRELARRGVQGIYCASGGTAAKGLLEAQLCRRLLVYHLPAIIGEDAPFVFGEGSVPLKHLLSRKTGVDALSIYELN